MFERLPAEEQAEWTEQAKEEHEAALTRWKAENKGKCSTTPTDCQRCIQGLVHFMQPILDLICEATGWMCSLIAGGPEPAHVGCLNMISIHLGTTSGDVKMNFGQAKWLRYCKYFVPMLCIDVEPLLALKECRVCALAVEEGFKGLISMNLDDEGVLFNSCEPAKPMALLFLSSGHPLPTLDNVKQQEVETLPCSLHSSISAPANASLSHSNTPFSLAASPVPSPWFSPHLLPAPSTTGSSPPLPSPECTPAQSHITPQPSCPCLPLSLSLELAHAQSCATTYTASLPFAIV